VAGAALVVLVDRQDTLQHEQDTGAWLVRRGDDGACRQTQLGADVDQLRDEALVDDAA
jgi:hypothetical protein